MLLGGGATIANAGREALALAERLAIPIVTTITAKGVVPERHPLVHGMIGMYGRRSGVFGLLECDVLLAVGCRFTDRITGRPTSFARGKTVIHIDVDAYELGKNVPAAVAIHADARRGAAALLAATAADRPAGPRRAWAARMAAARAICRGCVPHPTPSGIHPKVVMDALNAAKQPHDVVTTGVGQHQMFACHFLDFDAPRTFITSAGAGTMGFGLPAAIGAAVARPGTRAWVVDGDGSFQMTLQELATVAQEHLPITIIVLDNAQLGMVRQWQDRVYAGRHSAVRFDTAPGHPDFVRLAAAYGVPAESVADEPALRAALARSAASRGPMLLRVPVAPTVDNAPMMPAGTDLASYHGLCVATPGEPYAAAERRAIEEAAHA
jgi:acetolactate synthase-1/2/3 large subunit